MNERIKKLRKVLDLTQQEFADKIGTTRNNIAGYETGRRLPSEAAINLIIAKLNVNETWLRTGEGEMFVELPKNEVLEQQIREFLKGGNDSFRERLISLLLRLPPEQWETLERYARELVDTRSAPAFAPSHNPTIEEEARAEAAQHTQRIYEQILAEKKAQAGLSSESSAPSAGDRTTKQA